VSNQPPAFPVGRYIFQSNQVLAVGGGIGAADMQCQTEASSAGLPGTYVALLATSSQSAADHLGSLAGPWRRPDGALVTLGALDTPVLDAGITVDASGGAHGSFVYVGTTTGFHGLATAATDSCNDWTNVGGTGRYTLSATTTTLGPKGYGPDLCSGDHVYCAQR
jgi:hypothetical protein